MSRRASQDFVLLLEQSHTPFELAVLTGLIGADTGLHTVLDIGLAQPLRQRHLMDPEVGRDLHPGHAGTAATGDPDNILTELPG